jgi:hypothetical protein
VLAGHGAAAGRRGRRACRVVVEVAVGNALPASSGRVALTTLRDGPPAGRSGRRRPWAGRAGQVARKCRVQSAGVWLFEFFCLLETYGSVSVSLGLGLLCSHVLRLLLLLLLPSHSPSPAHSQLPASHWRVPAHAPSHRSPPHSPPYHITSSSHNYHIALLSPLLPFSSQTRPSPCYSIATH